VFEEGQGLCPSAVPCLRSACRRVFRSRKRYENMIQLFAFRGGLEGSAKGMLVRRPLEQCEASKGGAKCIQDTYHAP